MAHYIGLVHKDPDTEFGISFPDLPGCIALGASLEALRVNAIEALGLYAEVGAEHGLEPLPVPRSLAELQTDPAFLDAATGAVLMLVPSPHPGGGGTLLDVVVDADLLRALDQRADLTGLSRADVVAATLRAGLRPFPVDSAAE